MEFEI